MNYYTLFQLLRVVERIDKSNEGNVAVSNSLYIYIYICWGRPPPLLIVQKMYNWPIDLLNCNSRFFFIFFLFHYRNKAI